MKRYLKIAFFFKVMLIMLLPGLIVSCKKDEASPGLTPFVLESPPGFPKMQIPADNQPFEERIVLGRKLYYDAILSNNGRSCSSCHEQKMGFTINNDEGMPVLPHVNMAWKDTYMWDGSKTGTLEDVMLFEVEEFFNSDLSKLNNHPHYPDLFKEAYGVDEIKSEDVAKALAQFMRVMNSSSSKYDLVQRSLAQFTEEEAKGFAIFNGEKGSCFHCHAAPLFTDNALHNIGVDSVYDLYANRGYFNVSNDSADLGRMKTPTLRNVALRNRYMHDGRFQSLEEVVNHYNRGILKSHSLDPVLMKAGNTVQLNLSNEETEQLVAFLKTLTDTVYINNPFLNID